MWDRIYYNAIFGAMGGLVGWMLFGVFGDKTSAGDDFQQLLGGGLVGGMIGYLVVSAEAIRDRSLVRFCRLATYGLVLGGLGGALGMWLGDRVNFRLVGLIGPGQYGGAAVMRVLARGLGWFFLGLAVGVGEGAAARSAAKLCYGTLGGALGGFLGGMVFGVFLEASGKGTVSYVWGQALGLLILGAAIGALSALVQAVFQPASVRVLQGWQEGREFALLKAETVLGRDERADVALFRDNRVQKRHAIIRRDGRFFALLNQHAPPADTRVNGEPVADRCALHDGDRIELGGIVLRFQRRAAATRRHAVRSALPAASTGRMTQR